jgi:hypothetical protein
VVLSEICVLSGNGGFQRRVHVHQICFSLGRTATETCGMLKLAIGKEMLSRPKRFDLFFKLRS